MYLCKVPLAGVVIIRTCARTLTATASKALLGFPSLPKKYGCSRSARVTSIDPLIPQPSNFEGLLL